jgi:hypothetical protein
VRCSNSPFVTLVRISTQLVRRKGVIPKGAGPVNPLSFVVDLFPGSVLTRLDAVRAENRDRVSYQHVCGQTADRPRSPPSIPHTA